MYASDENAVGDVDPRAPCHAALFDATISLIVKTNLVFRAEQIKAAGGEKLRKSYSVSPKNKKLEKKEEKSANGSGKFLSQVVCLWHGGAAAARRE